MNELEHLSQCQDVGVDIWIAMVDKEIVARGERLKDVMKEVREKRPGKEPFVTKLPSNKVMLL